MIGLIYSNILRFRGESYRYGFNTQEKDDEIAQGIYTSEYWEYDSRIGRRWNVDPVVKEYISGYAVLGDNPIFYIDPMGDDWFKNEAGDIKWNDSRESSLKIDDVDFINIGQTLEFQGVSYIDKVNDIPVKYVDSDKLIVNISIKGNYDDKGKFIGFTTEVVAKQGYTFGFVPGTHPTIGGVELNNKKEGTLFKTVTVNTTVNNIEKPFLGMLGRIVNVQQKYNFEINKDGDFSMKVGHGTFPSFNLVLNNTSQTIYNFRQHSWHDSHSWWDNSFGNYPEESVLIYRWWSINDNQNSQKLIPPYLKFGGYTTDTWYLNDYNHYPTGIWK